MARMCMLTGAKTKSGNNRSHSMAATKRTFKVNMITKKVDLGDGMKVNIKMSARAYKKFRKVMIAA
jgi:large subunit ribosomal protein L28